jgi:hypothetical protein
MTDIGGHLAPRSLAQSVCLKIFLWRMISLELCLTSRRGECTAIQLISRGRGDAQPLKAELRGTTWN